MSDGQHQATALLEVQASEPYLRVANGSNLVVPQGGQSTIDTAVLHLDTNLDIRNGDEVHYHVTAGPRWGQLLRAGQPATAFSQQDLVDGAILYSHNGSLSPRDTLAFSVEAGPVHTDATLQVTIALEGPLAPLHLVQHKKIDPKHVAPGKMGPTLSLLIEAKLFAVKQKSRSFRHSEG